MILFRTGGGSRLTTPPTTRHHHHRPVIVNTFNPPSGGAQPSLHLRYNSAKALTHTHTFLPSERWILQLLVPPPLLSGVRRADPLHDAHQAAWHRRRAAAAIASGMTKSGGKWRWLAGLWWRERRRRGGRRKAGRRRPRREQQPWQAQQRSAGVKAATTPRRGCLTAGVSRHGCPRPQRPFGPLVAEDAAGTSTARHGCQTGLWRRKQ